jgi:hypothetical protein
MKKNIVSVIVFLIGYLWMLFSTLLILHIFNSFLKLSQHDLSLITVFLIFFIAIGLFLGVRTYSAKKKGK